MSRLKDLAALLLEPDIKKQWQQITSTEGPNLQKILRGDTITINNKNMKFKIFTYGQKPAEGWTLIFGMHGGGGTDAQSNDQQWNNHWHLYDKQMQPGTIWFVPRSCQDVWDMWWQPYLLEFFKTVIKGFVFNGHVNPNKIFISGYSAGGDGVYHLAPMMADWLAGAAMMAGHPNNAELQNTRNIAFSIQVGADDSGYQRNEQAKTYIAKMGELGQKYGGFKLQYNTIHQGCGHWMNLEDAKMFPKFFGQTRNPYPDFILFKQAERARQTSFYYIGVNPDEHKKLITVKKNGNEFYIESDPIKVKIFVNRLMVDFKKEVVIFFNSKKIISQIPKLKMDVVSSSIKQRQDPFYIFEDSFVCDPNAPPIIDKPQPQPQPQPVNPTPNVIPQPKPQPQPQPNVIPQPKPQPKPQPQPLPQQPEYYEQEQVQPQQGQEFEQQYEEGQEGEYGQYGEEDPYAEEDPYGEDPYYGEEEYDPEAQEGYYQEVVVIQVSNNGQFWGQQYTSNGRNGRSMNIQQNWIQQYSIPAPRRSQPPAQNSKPAQRRSQPPAQNSKPAVRRSQPPKQSKPGKVESKLPPENVNQDQKNLQQPQQVQQNGVDHNCEHRPPGQVQGDTCCEVY